MVGSDVYSRAATMTQGHGEPMHTVSTRRNTFACIPGNKLLGCYHLVPTGRFLERPTVAPPKPCQHRLSTLVEYLPRRVTLVR